MNLTLTIFNISRHLGVGFLLVGLLLTEVHGQPRLSLHIERLDFNGNLLRFPDGTFIAERYGELYRLGPNGQVERKLPFDRTHPVPEITAYNTYFQELLAPLADGGFFAVLDFSLPYLGSVRNRPARFDRDGRIVSAHDGSYDPVSVGTQLPDGRVLVGSDFAETDFRQWAFEVLGTNGYSHGSDVWGSTRAVAFQGSNVLAGGNFSLSQLPTQTVALLRMNLDLFLDSSFRPPPCKDVSQLAVQSDGRIIARGRLANDQGIFESEISVFRLNTDGSFERRIFQTASNDWQVPAFAIEASGDIIILNSLNADEVLPSYPKLWRYHPDGTLKETISLPFSPRCCFGDGFDRIEFLADGSFLAHFLVSDQGPSVYQHHWVGFKANGELHASFPPTPFDYVTFYLSVTNLVTYRSVRIEQSKDLLLWQQIPTIQVGNADDVARFLVKGPIRIIEDPGPHFFRVVQ